VQINFQEPLPRPWLEPECYLAKGKLSRDSNILKVLAGSKIRSSEHRCSFPGIGLAKSGVEAGRCLTIYPARGYPQGIYSRPTIIVGRAPGSLETAFRRHSHISQSVVLLRIHRSFLQSGSSNGDLVSFLLGNLR
jgi:hypothetical protein